MEVFNLKLLFSNKDYKVSQLIHKFIQKNISTYILKHTALTVSPIFWMECYIIYRNKHSTNNFILFILHSLCFPEQVLPADSHPSGLYITVNRSYLLLRVFLYTNYFLLLLSQKHAPWITHLVVTLSSELHELPICK